MKMEVNGFQVMATMENFYNTLKNEKKKNFLGFT
jgi:hypothetical protein